MTLSKGKLLLLVKIKLLEVCNLSLSFSFKRKVDTSTMFIILNRLKM
jgi:hypothetical protein